MSVSDALQEQNTRGQLGLTQSSMFHTRLSAPRLCGHVMMSNRPFTIVKRAFLLKQPGGHIGMTYFLMQN